MFNHNSQELFLLTSLPYINNLYDFHTWAGYSSLHSFCLYTSNSLTFSISPTLRRSTQLKSGVSPGLPRRESLTNTLRTLPFSLSCCFIHLHHMTGVLLDPSVISQMHSKHLLLTVCKTNIALDIPYLLAFVCVWKWFSVPWISHSYPKLLKSGFHGSKHIALDRNGLLAFGSKDESLIIHSISGRIPKACNWTKSFSALLRTILTLRYQP